jgi:hypothetical protein
MIISLARCLDIDKNQGEEMIGRIGASVRQNATYVS